MNTKLMNTNGDNKTMKNKTITKNDRFVCKILQTELDEFTSLLFKGAEETGSPPPARLFMLKSGKVKGDFPLDKALSLTAGLTDGILEENGDNTISNSLTMEFVKKFFSKKIKEGVYDGILQIATVESYCGSTSKEMLEKIMKAKNPSSMMELHGGKKTTSVLFYYEMKLDNKVLQGFHHYPFHIEDGSVMWDYEDFYADPVSEFAQNELGDTAVFGGTAVLMNLI